MSDEKGYADKLLSALIDKGSPAAFKGGLVSALAMAMMFFTRSVPQEWADWYQWPIYVIFLIGLARLATGIL